MAKMKGKFREEIQNSGFNIERYEKKLEQEEVKEALEDRVDKHWSTNA